MIYENKMNFNRFLAVTNDGKVGDLMLKLISDEEIKYVASIPNEETEYTCYDENEVEIIDKSIFENLN